MTYRSPSLVVAVLGTLLFTACASEAEDVQESSAVGTPTEAVAPQQFNAEEAPASSGQILPATTGSTPKLNPPHGEPGHVCEIAVGEPLDGSGSAAGTMNQTINMAPPSNGAAPTFSTMPPSSPVNKAPANGGSGRMNPAHGEPGHVCEIPVGQPLP
jgi:hypothetical protein